MKINLPLVNTSKVKELMKDNKNINIKIFSIAIARHFIRE